MESNLIGSALIVKLTLYADSDRFYNRGQP